MKEHESVPDVVENIMGKRFKKRDRYKSTGYDRDTKEEIEEEE
jgi:hypothetical protein